jgi:hypothetical protein
MRVVVDIVGKARKLERTISNTVEAAVEGMIGRSGLAPLEIIHAVVDRAEQQVQEIGRGRRVFPFNRVKVHVLARPGDKTARARFGAVAEGPPSLAERLQGRLQSLGCTAHDITVDVVYASRAGADWHAPEFHIEFDRTALATRVVAAPVPPLQMRVTVIDGKTDKRAYTFRGGRIDIGRRTDVLDTHQRLVRRNHVAFADDDSDVNHSVSRRHAHVIWKPEKREYRLCVDQSAHGTSILRDGRTVRVPSGERGVRLQSGDDMLLGQARLHVVIGA